MNKKTRDGIIDDLLQKRPKGPGGVEITYEVEESYDWHKDKYFKVLIPSHKNYGYEDKILFQLMLHGQEDVRKYVRQRWFANQGDPPRATVTRRTNRIWSRIENAVKNVKTTGGRGIYKVHTRWGSDSRAYIFARDAEEALIMYKTFFPKTDENIKAGFVEFGDAELLYQRNNKLCQANKDRIKRLKGEIRFANEKIKSLEAHISTITMLEGHQVAVETNE